MKFWGPDPELIELAVAAAARRDEALCIDVGGNHVYAFPGAITVGFEGQVKVDFERDRLPYADQEVGFLFCRHTLEDLADPDHLLREIKRVAKAGYLEIPSPLAELTRGVDAVGDHVGYCHHRWVGVGAGSHLKLCAKYPVIERLALPDYWELLWRSSWRWNTYALFDEAHPLTFEVLSNERGFSLAERDGRGMPRPYRDALVGMADVYLLSHAKE